MAEHFGRPVCDECEGHGYVRGQQAPCGKCKGTGRTGEPVIEDAPKKGEDAGDGESKDHSPRARRSY